ncbi:MAG: glycosyltransferase family 2 protein, partial [Planctomycetota bacterium]
MSSTPTVTVLTPTYNRPACLAHAIRSVHMQRFTDWEMLVINDGGTDVRAVVESFQDPRIVYIQRPENKGKAACLNLGLERARGRYIAYLDDDDLWYPNHLSALTRALDDNPSAGVAYSDLYAVVFLRGENGRRIPIEKRVCVCRDYNRMLMFHFNHTLHVSLVHR